MRYYNLFLKNRKTLYIGLAAAAILLFISNYLLFVSSKIIVGIENPFVLRGKGLYVILTVWFIEITIVGQFILNRFYADLVRLYKRAEELEKASLFAKYQALQNQLNPHFLFNSLNTLISEIENEPKNAIEFTRNLADTYRYILYCQDKHSISLSEEMEFVDTYIALQKVRLGNHLYLDNKIDERYKEVMIPPLALQLLIENVIKYNVINADNPMNIVLVTEMKGEDVWLCVKNRIKPKKGVISSGKGLVNLAQRYKMLCDKDIFIEKTDCEFIVKIPLVYE